MCGLGSSSDIVPQLTDTVDMLFPEDEGHDAGRVLSRSIDRVATALDLSPLTWLSKWNAIIASRLPPARHRHDLRWRLRSPKNRARRSQTHRQRNANKVRCLTTPRI
jgi:hypothetical protein